MSAASRVAMVSIDDHGVADDTIGESGRFTEIIMQLAPPKLQPSFAMLAGFSTHVSGPLA